MVAKNNHTDARLGSVGRENGYYDEEDPDEEEEKDIDFNDLYRKS